MNFSSIRSLSLKITVFLLLVYPSILFAYSGGDGAEGNPYEISNASDLQQLSTDSVNWNKSFKLTSDIDMDGIAWTPVSTFSGTFDGQGYTISNLSISMNTTTSVNVGFISILASGGKLYHLTITNLVYNLISTEDIYAGGLVGINAGEIEQCGTHGSLMAISSGVGDIYAVICGGLIGKNNDNGEVRECFSTVNVRTEVGDDPDPMDYNETSAGGLVGDNNYIIEDCFAMGNVEAYNDDAYAGGFVAWNDNTGIIRRCYSAGNAYSYSTSTDSAYESGGGFAESNECGIIEDCFYNYETSGNAIGVVWDSCGDSNVTGLPTSEMMKISNFVNAGWDFTNESTNGTADIWRMCLDGIDYPKLAWQYSPYGDFICPNGVSFEDFSVLANEWLRDVALTSDVNYDGITDIFDLMIFIDNWLDNNYSGDYAPDLPGFQGYIHINQTGDNALVYLGTDGPYTGVVSGNVISVTLNDAHNVGTMVFTFLQNGLSFTGEYDTNGETGTFSGNKI